MKTTEHRYKDLNEVKDIEQLHFRGIVGAVRLILRRIILKFQSDEIVDKFLKYKFKSKHPA